MVAYNDPGFTRADYRKARTARSQFWNAAELVEDVVNDVRKRGQADITLGNRPGWVTPDVMVYMALLEHRDEAQVEYDFDHNASSRGWRDLTRQAVNIWRSAKHLQPFDVLGDG